MVTKKMVAEGVDFDDAVHIVFKLMQQGKKITVDPINNKFWIFDHGKPRK